MQDVHDLLARHAQREITDPQLRPTVQREKRAANQP